MKKYTKVLALALALTMMLSMSVFAEGAIQSVSTKGGASLVAPEQVEGAEKFGLAYSGEAGEMYLVLVLSGNEETDPIPTAGNILYVNQATAAGDGKVIFDTIFPSDIKTSTIYVAGGSLTGLTPVGSIAPEAPAFDKGDINMDYVIDGEDANQMLQYLVGNIELSDAQMLLFDINGDSIPDGADPNQLLQYLVGNRDTLY